MLALLARLGSSFESRLSYSFDSSRNRGSKALGFTCVGICTSRTRVPQKNVAQGVHQPAHAGHIDTGSSFRSWQGNLRCVSVSSSRLQKSPESKTGNHDAIAGEHHALNGERQVQVRKVRRLRLDSGKKAEEMDGDRQLRALAFPVMIRQALLQKDFAGLTNRLLSTETDRDMIKKIPGNVFSEVLETIRPYNAMAWMEPLYHDLSPEVAERLRIPHVYDLVRDHLCQVLEVFARRKDAGEPFNASDYSIILGMARWAGLKDVAAAFWNSMLADQVTPNLKCYNAYMGAVVSNLHFRADVKHKYRVTPFNTEARQQKSLGRSFEAYRIGGHGIKEAVMSIYKEMRENHISANEETYRLLIIGVAREGDLGTVKAILKQVWKVDADALAEGRDDVLSILQGRPGPDSPLYPDNRLLYTIVHAFGINNDIPGALRILDYVSRSFGMDVRLGVWRELFNSTFVSSLPRQKSKGESASLPKRSVLKLWETMRNEPYNLKPSMDMYDILIKSLFVQQRTKDMWFYMNEALPLYRHTRLTAETAFERLGQAATGKRIGSDAFPSTGGYYEDYTRSDIIQKRALLLVKRWVRLLLGSMRSWKKVDKDLSWSTQKIPKIVYEWRDFMPSEVWYEIPSGSVKIQFRTAQQKLASQVEGYTKSREKAKVLRDGSKFPWGTEGVQTRRMRKHQSGQVQAKEG